MRPRRLRALVLSISMVAAACGGGPAPDAPGGPIGEGLGSTTVPGPEGSAPPPGAPGGPPQVDGGGGPAPGTSGEQPGSPAAPGPIGRPGSPTTTSGSASPAYGSGPVGSFAPILLRPEPAREIVVEILAQAGAAPRGSTSDHVVSVLRQVTGKEVGLAGGSIPGEGRTWSAAEIRAAADSGSGVPQGDGVAVIRILFLLGHFEDDGVIGVAVRGDVAAIFTEEVERAETPVVSEGTIEAAVTTHEVGHLLGLVDLFVDTGRDDPEHPGHSTNSRSVMFWAVESESVTDVLTGGPPRDFDATDRADLERIRKG